MNQLMKEELKNTARRLGISDIGITKYKDKTAVVCLFAYPSTPLPGANLSLYTYGADYHSVINRLLRELGTIFFAEDFSVHADIGEPIDRSLAYRAGLGFYGKNGMLIHPTLGSFFFIGWIETSVSLPIDTPIEKKCLGCDACFAACPGGALSDRGLNVAKCASAISQKKGDLSKDEAAILIKSGLCFGCDACQTICPHNQTITATYLSDFTENLLPSLDITFLETISNREFMRLYKNRAFSWRGKSVLLRNLKLLNCTSKQ